MQEGAVASPLLKASTPGSGGQCAGGVLNRDAAKNAFGTVALNAHHLGAISSQTTTDF